MMLTYMEPDGTVSRPTHQAGQRKRSYPSGYYWPYLYLGRKREIPEFVAFANRIYELTQENHLDAPDCLMEYMTHPELIDYESGAGYEPEDFRKLYWESGSSGPGGKFHLYADEGEEQFSVFQHPSIDVALKIGGCICEHRAFQAEELIETEDGFWLKQVMHGWYYLPFKEPQGTSDWWKMDHAKREKKLGPDLSIEVEVHEETDGLRVDFHLHGVFGAPFRIEAAVLAPTTRKGSISACRS